MRQALLLVAVVIVTLLHCFVCDKVCLFVRFSIGFVVLFAGLSTTVHETVVVMNLTEYTYSGCCELGVGRALLRMRQLLTNVWLCRRHRRVSEL